MVNKPRSKSLSYDEIIDHPLCLCEYINKNNERSHLLMCCCNCEALDSLCTKFFCCCHITSSSHRHLFLESINDILDRIRYPFFGGARKFNWEFLMSLVYIFIYKSIGTRNFVLTIFTLILVPTMLYMQFFLARYKQSAKQNRTSLKELTTMGRLNQNSTEGDERIQIAYFIVLNILIYTIYLFNSDLFNNELQSVTDWYFLNAILLTTLFLHLYLHYADPGFLRSTKHMSDEIEPSIHQEQDNSRSNGSYCNKCSLKRDEQVGHCTVCKSCVLRRDHHCFWVDNCIGYYNHKVFVSYLVCFFVLFSYSLLAILKRFGTLECALWQSDAGNLRSCLFDEYYENHSRASLVLICIQLGPLILYMGLLLIQQFIFISIGKTQQELFKMSQKHYRFSLFIYIKENLKVHSLCSNWTRFFKFRSKVEFIYKENSRYEHLI